MQEFLFVGLYLIGIGTHSIPSPGYPRNSNQVLCALLVLVEFECPEFRLTECLAIRHTRNL
jgi:hypothetical protein